VVVFGRRFRAGLLFDLDDALADVFELTLERRLETRDLLFQAVDFALDVVLDRFQALVTALGVEAVFDGPRDVGDTLGDHVPDCRFQVVVEQLAGVAVELLGSLVRREQLDDEFVLWDFQFRGLLGQPVGQLHRQGDRDGSLL